MTDHLPKTLTLRTAFEQYILPEHTNKSTIQRYHDVLNRWELWTDNPPVGRITNQTLMQYREACLAAGNRPTTFNTHRRHF